MDIAWIGAIGGSTIGVLGGAFGMYCGIKSTQTPAERRFLINSTIWMGIVAILLIVLPMVLAHIGVIPQWLFWMTFALFYILLLPTIFWANKRVATLRAEKA